MAYNKNNYNKRTRLIIALYKTVKNEDVPDTEIVRRIFPQHNVFLSYRQWMNIKGTPIPSEIPTNQLNLFAAFDR